MPRRQISEEEYEAYAAEFNRRSTLAQEKGEEIRKTLEPKLIAEGFKGWHAYVDVYTGRYVVGRDYEEAAKKAKAELGSGRLCWGFDIGVPPQIYLGGAFLSKEVA
ncbi:MAG: hypothetical protein A2843_02195 [Candidatus Wildermuthbacteria bacterium RIFCSPHIGHO2_01_FULL_48_27b]|uniref:Uncharacterized protein n=1 Tax=Candidatus Wildermuthbacteria bacterium RIFCSPHIGHO2_01_FULL_48_27b TaxID=1802447 RepID=A0A1G2QUE6_9BACT|nr:MAG: hypothetical protein A2843_02195 [Candidatus Wildermuthbacteria bacterium RIFCSPHIGHO2_01_FULL_48_27b]